MRLAVLFLLSALAGCASTEPSGPDAAALGELISAARPGRPPEIKDVRCYFIAAEGSEWRCRYHERAADGRWVRLEIFVAADADGWLLIDGVRRADDPPLP